jgi:hypothetical protein
MYDRIVHRRWQTGPSARLGAAGRVFRAAAGTDASSPVAPWRVSAHFQMVISGTDRGGLVALRKCHASTSAASVISQP